MLVVKSIGAYAIAIIAFSLFWNWFFDKPSDHDILITVLTGFCASTIAGGIIEDEHIADKQEEFTTYLITAIVTTGFWIYQFYDTYSDFAEIEKNQILVAIGSVMYSWNNLLMAAVTFFTIMARSKK